MEPYYVVERLLYDRLAEARADARRAALVPSHGRRRVRRVIGRGLISFGRWLMGPDGAPTLTCDFRKGQ
jgi:hypothetical protein